MKRIHVCGGGVRALLVADIARRVEQLAGRHCLVTWAFEAPHADDLNIYPADEITAEHPPSALLVNCEHAQNSFHVADFAGHVPGEFDGDPLALRLALLELASEQSTVDVGAAAKVLGRWRATVAQWAHSPGAPLSRRHVEAAATAFGELDTASGLEVLRGVEADNQVPPGSKFETFAYLDRVVGVDITRDLGG